MSPGRFALVAGCCLGLACAWAMQPGHAPARGLPGQHVAIHPAARLPVPASPALRARQDALVAQAGALLDMRASPPGGIEEARRLLQQALDIDALHSQAHVEMARYIIRDGYRGGRGNAERAVLKHADDELALALSAGPRNANAYVLLGALRMYQERDEASLVALRRAEELGTDNPWLYINLYATYIDLARWNDAARSLHKLDRRPDRARWPANVQASLFEGWLNLQRHAGDVPGTEATYRRAARIHPYPVYRSGHALFLLGAKNDPRAAIAVCRLALVVDSDDWRARDVLALAQFVQWDQLRHRDPRKAKALRRSARKVLTDHGDVMTTTVFWLTRSRVFPHLVRTLQAEGWSINDPNRFGDRPLTAAIRFREPLAVGWLLAHGANPDMPDGFHMRPLLYAVIRSDQASFDLLLAHGADVDARSGDLGTTALIEAANAREVGMVRKLLDRHARTDLATLSNETALMEAAGQGSEPVVRMLLAAGADPSIRFSNGQDAASIADTNHHPALAAFLRSRVAARARK